MNTKEDLLREVFACGRQRGEFLFHHKPLGAQTVLLHVGGPMESGQGKVEGLLVRLGEAGPKTLHVVVTKAPFVCGEVL